jgi:hypothetical protein
MVFARDSCPYIPVSSHRNHGLQGLCWLLLHSSKAIRKEPAKVTPRPGRSSPDPRLGPPVELCGSRAGRLRDLGAIGKTPPYQRITPKGTPPALLEIEPAGSHRNEDMLDARVIREPGVGLRTGVAGQIICHAVLLPLRIRLFNLLKQGDVALGIARRRTPGDDFAIADPASAP